MITDKNEHGDGAENAVLSIESGLGPTAETISEKTQQISSRATTEAIVPSRNQQDGEKQVDAQTSLTLPSQDATQPSDLQESTYLSPKDLSLLTTAFTIATFMIAIDGSILATAIPRITSDFHSLNDMGWYGSAYLLTEMAFQPTFGRIYTFFDARITYLVSIVIFEIGSILCAAAPNSTALITGRAISGAGAAGLLCGSLSIYGRSVPLKKRPLGLALVTSMYGIAGVIGPTLGGVITDTPRLTWRFCFWMNLPAGAVTFFIAYKTFPRKPPRFGDVPLLDKIMRLDIFGGFLLAAGLVALFIALQCGGSTYPWSDPGVYACMIVFGIMLVGFIAWQAYQKEEATIPLRILSQRSVAISCAFNIILAIAQVTHTYYLAIYFQAVRGTNAATSGVRGLPYGILASTAIMITGYMMSWQGYYVPFMWAGASIFIAGACLLRTLDIDSSMGKWVGYQILTGFGFGLTEQVPFIAVQVVLPDEDMPTACALVVFSRCFGGAIGLSIAQNVFMDVLKAELVGIKGVNIAAIAAAGASEVAKAVDPSLLYSVRVAFNSAIMKTFVIPIAVGSVGLLLSFGMERKRIEDEKPLEERLKSSSTISPA